MKSPKGVLEETDTDICPVLCVISFNVAHVHNILRNLDFFRGLGI